MERGRGQLGARNAHRLRKRLQQLNAQPTVDTGTKQRNHEENEGYTPRGTHGKKLDPNFDFANLPTISRSGDASGSGHELKDFKTQERYWAVIEDRLVQHFTKYDPNALQEVPLSSDGSRRRQMRESEDIILIHLRRVREGVSSAQRLDEFAVTVYDASLSFAVLCKNTTQTAAALSHFPAAHISYAKNHKGQVHPHCVAIAVLSLAFHLVDSFASQKAYYHHLSSLPESCLPRNSEGFTWISSLRRAVQEHNFLECDKLTQRPSVVSLCENLGLGTESGVTSDLHRRSLLSVVNALRSKLRESSWTMLRLSYRELRLGEGSDTATWLSSILFLRGTGSHEDGVAVLEWLRKKVTEGHVVEADGSRWVIRR